MNDSAIEIDFAKLRKLEKVRAKKERLQQKKDQEEEEEHNDDGRGNVKPSRINSLPLPPSCCTASEFTSKSNSIDQFNISSIVAPSWSEDSTSTHATNRTEDCHNREQKLLEQPILLKNVYYIPQCLNNEYMEYLSSWLHFLPRHNSANKTNANNEKEYFGKWTRLKFSQRNVALFDLRRAASDGNAAKGSDTLDMGMDMDMDTKILNDLCNLLIEIEAFPQSHPPNHILINEYQPSEGIMPHTDGPLYFHKTATFSIGGDVLFQFTRRLQESAQEQQQQTQQHKIGGDDIVMQIMLSGKGSLIVFDDDAYINHCHSINDRIVPSKHNDNDADKKLSGSHGGVSEIVEYVEYASEKCVNLKKGSVVKRKHRFSLTFRHKYSQLQ